MRATILAPGSRGDVQPYLALGQALQQLGHACTLVTTEDHEALVRSYGLGVVLLPINVAAELARVETNRAVEGGGMVSSFRQFAAIAKRASRALVEQSLEAARGADVLVTNFTTAMVAGALAKKLGVRVVQAFNVPVTPTSAFPGALFPGMDFSGAARQLAHRLTRAAVWATGRASANDVCRELLGAPSAPLLPGSFPGLLPGPVLYGFSEAFLPRPAEWAREVEVTGFWFVEEPDSFAPPPELVRFLDEGPAPVCVGFGSMSTEAPEAVTALVGGAVDEGGGEGEAPGGDAAGVAGLGGGALLAEGHAVGRVHLRGDDDEAVRGEVLEELVVGAAVGEEAVLELDDGVRPRGAGGGDAERLRRLELALGDVALAHGEGAAVEGGAGAAEDRAGRERRGRRGDGGAAGGEEQQEEEQRRAHAGGGVTRGGRRCQRASGREPAGVGGAGQPRCTRTALAKSGTSRASAATTSSNRRGGFRRAAACSTTSCFIRSGCRSNRLQRNSSGC